MMYTQRRLSGVGFAGSGSRRLPRGSATKRRGGFPWIAVGAAALVCALLIWITVQIHGTGRAAYPAEHRFPRNTVEMHGTYAADTCALPWLRC